MPRHKLVRTNELPYHITTRSNNKEWFYIPQHRCWEFATQLLKEANEKFSIKVDAFVLMSNHYHLCLFTPKANIDEIMHFFNQNLGRKIAREANRINRIFGAPYKWSLITQQDYYWNVIRYIYQNPIRAGIVKNCQEYAFSDLKNQDYTQEQINWFNDVLTTSQARNHQKELRKYICDAT